MEKNIIISALGEKSFSEGQIARLRSSMDISFISCMDVISSGDLIKTACGAELLAITRRCIKELDSDTINGLTELKYLAVYSTGYEWIDIEALKKRNILLSFLPDYSTVAVAEHAIGLLLALTRRIHLSNDLARGLVPHDVSLRGSEVMGKTIGIVGYGRIGKKIASILKSFEAEIRFYDTAMEQKTEGSTDYNTLLETSDIIILACSKKRDEKPLISAEQLAMMKPGALLVNVARAGLVDSAALLDAIKSKRLAGYAVDDNVEALKSTDLEHGRILQTHHTAWYSNEAIKKGTECWVNNIVGFASGTPVNLVRY